MTQGFSSGDIDPDKLESAPSDSTPSMRVRRGGNLLLIDSDSYFAAMDKLLEILHKGEAVVDSIRDWEYRGEDEGQEPHYYLEVILSKYSPSKMDMYITECP